MERQTREGERYREHKRTIWQWKELENTQVTALCKTLHPHTYIHPRKYTMTLELIGSDDIWTWDEEFRGQGLGRWWVITLIVWDWKVDRHLLRLCALGTRRYRPSCVRRSGTRPRRGFGGWWRWRARQWSRRRACTGWPGAPSPALPARRPTSRWWWGVVRLWPRTWERRARLGLLRAHWKTRQSVGCRLTGKRERNTDRRLQNLWMVHCWNIYFRRTATFFKKSSKVVHFMWLLLLCLWVTLCPIEIW